MPEVPGDGDVTRGAACCGDTSPADTAGGQRAGRGGEVRRHFFLLVATAHSSCHPLGCVDNSPAAACAWPPPARSRVARAVPALRCRLPRCGTRAWRWRLRRRCRRRACAAPTTPASSPRTPATARPRPRARARRPRCWRAWRARRGPGPPSASQRPRTGCCSASSPPSASAPACTCVRAHRSPLARARAHARTLARLARCAPAASPPAARLALPRCAPAACPGLACPALPCPARPPRLSRADVCAVSRPAHPARGGGGRGARPRGLFRAH